MTISHSNAAKTPAGEIFYRGDSRKPTDVFARGFTTIDFASKHKTGILRQQKDINGLEMTPDVYSGVMVCITRNFFASAIFPINKFISGESYIYVIDINNMEDILNTQKIQWGIAQGMLLNAKAADGIISDAKVKNAMWPMYTQEHAVKEIKTERIICGISIERMMNDSSFQTGGRFKIQHVVRNFRYNGSHSDRVVGAMEDLKHKLMSERISDKKWLTIPSQRDGYKASEPDNILTGSRSSYGLPLRQLTIDHKNQSDS